MIFITATVYHVTQPSWNRVKRKFQTFQTAANGIKARDQKLLTSPQASQTPSCGPSVFLLCSRLCKCVSRPHLLEWLKLQISHFHGLSVEWALSTCSLNF